MKKLFIAALAIIATFSLVACEKNEEKQSNTANNTVVSETTKGTETNQEPEIKQEPKTNQETENNTEEQESHPASAGNDMYYDVVNDYKGAVANINLDEVDSEEKIIKEYGYINPSLVEHIARYESNGTDISLELHDIDKNGVDELIVGASGNAGAIYSYNKKNSTPVKIFFQDTMERGNLAIYDNGVILSSGAGGAALHYYEFGKIATDGISYELLESVEEEYISENEVVYKNAKTGEKLSYKTLDEIMNKYISGATEVKF